MDDPAIETIIFELISLGYDMTYVRDDIFELTLSLAHKIKPSTYKPMCYKKVVDILSKCVCFFSVSRENVDYFIKQIEDIYFKEMKRREDTLKCAYLINVLKQNVSVHYSESTIISLELLKKAKEIITNYSFFDSDLNSIMKMQTFKFSSHSIPWVIINLCESILQNGACKIQGIFRVSGDANEIDLLRKKMLIFESVPKITDPNISASLLKSWFRDISDPMFPIKYYDECISCANDTNMPLQIYDRLPKLQKEIICYITKFVRVFMIPTCVEITKMTFSNMALVWSPNLLRCPYKDPMQVAQFTASQNKFVQMLFENLDISIIDHISINAEASTIH